MHPAECGIEIQRLGPFILIAIECESESSAAGLLRLLLQDDRLSFLLHDLSRQTAAMTTH